MATLTLEQVTTPVTEEEAYASIIADLQDQGFTADSWEEGSVARSLIEILARTIATQSTWVNLIAQQMFLSTAAASGLTSLAASNYNEVKKAAIPTQGYLYLSASAGVGPSTWDIGDLQVADTTYGYTFSNTQTGSLGTGAADFVKFEADVSGSSRNVALGTVTDVIQGIAGVSFSNPIYSGSTWITQAGADEESDETLKTRCKSKWATLPYSMPRDGYANICLNVDGIAKVSVDTSNPRGPGSVDVYVYGDGAAAGSDAIATAQADCTAHKPNTSDVLVKSASTYNLQIYANVYYEGNYTEVQITEGVISALKTYVNALPMGGKKLGGFPGYIVLSSLIDAIRSVDGVVDVDITGPAANVQLSTYEVAVLDEDFLNTSGYFYTTKIS